MKINKVIKFLILSDVALEGGFGFLTPIFAIFLTQNIRGGNVEVAGFAAAIYWTIKSLLIVPIGKFLDKTDGEKDELIFVVVGNLLMAGAVLGYLFAFLPRHIYGLEVIFAIGMAMNIPGYTSIFTRHIDRGKEAFEWSVRGSLIGFGAGIAGVLGGMTAYRFGFSALFIGVAVFFFLSAVFPLFIFRDIFANKKHFGYLPLPFKDEKEIE